MRSMIVEFNGEDVGLESCINTVYLKAQWYQYNTLLLHEVNIKRKQKHKDNE